MSHARFASISGRFFPRTKETREATVASDVVFEDLYSAAFPRVYSFVRCQVATTETAQEIVSRVFLKACKHRERLPAGDAAMHWIFRIAKTTLVDYWRVEGRRDRVSVSLQELSDLPSSGTTPEVAYERRQQVSDLLQTVGDLPTEDRLMLALKFAADRTNRDIAHILNLSEAAVSMRLLRALRRLKRRLQSIGWNESN